MLTHKGHALFVSTLEKSFLTPKTFFVHEKRNFFKEKMMNWSQLLHRDKKEKDKETNLHINLKFYCQDVVKKLKLKIFLHI